MYSLVFVLFIQCCEEILDRIAHDAFLNEVVAVDHPKRKLKYFSQFVRALGLADSRRTVNKKIWTGKTQLFVVFSDFVQIEAK